MMTGKDLAALRKAAGLSQGELARRAGIGRQAVSYWETKPFIRRGRGWPWAVERIGTVIHLPDCFRTNTRAHDMSLMEAEAYALDRAALLARIAEREARIAATRRVRCGAKTRKGTPCRGKSEPGKKRCKFHGGRSTGPRTEEGKERIREAQRQRWAAWQAERDGRPPGG